MSISSIDTRRAAAPPRPAPLVPPAAAVTNALGAVSFDGLGLAAPLVRALREEGYERPTPIQERAIPYILEGRDILGTAQTGTGKTAAFVLPLLQKLGERASSGRVRALVLSPTRELAAQIAERAGAYARHAKIRHAVVFGGVNQKRNERAMDEKPDILVATPGRLLDLMGQGIVRLGAVEYVVLDEADRMLDMGFIHDVRRIFATLPKERQTLLFSATMPREIAQLADAILKNPARVSVTPAQTAAETVSQQVYFVGKNDKRALLERVLGTDAVTRAIVFTRTKHGANRVSDQLERAGIGSAAIHGNKSQNARERALEAFREGTTKVLVATDIAARGIDVDGISHVVNYDIPNIAETYVHRIGRTGRAGATGHAVSFCDPEERAYLNGIERLLQRKIPVEATPAFAPPAPGQALADHDRDRADVRGGGRGAPRPAQKSAGVGAGPGAGRRSFRPRRRPTNKDR